jgi:hypothetical protein
MDECAKVRLMSFECLHVAANARQSLVSICLQYYNRRLTRCRVVEPRILCIKRMSCLDVCRHPNVRIEAHKVYNEFIQDKHHIHMNSTKWLTLTEYVKYLGREGLCKVEDSPKGWFMQLIHRDPEQVCLLSNFSSNQPLQSCGRQAQRKYPDASKL